MADLQNQSRHGDGQACQDRAAENFVLPPQLARGRAAAVWVRWTDRRSILRAAACRWIFQFSRASRSTSTKPIAASTATASWNRTV